MAVKRMHYSRYKTYYSKYKAYDYDKKTKYITVEIPSNEYKEYSNEGNRYQMDEFFADIRDDSYTGNIEENKRWVQVFKAKNKENALRNAKRLCRQNNMTLLRFSYYEDFRDC